MAGHNKWSKIKHKKGAADAKRAKLWTKVIREITVAARIGGTDPAGNARLRKAIDDARAVNMPKDTMERAVKRGDANDDESNFEELVYEGYGPAGVALYIECTTDNRNRTSGEISSTLRRGNGTLGKSGSVAFMFEKKGHFVFDKEPEEGAAATEDQLLEVGMEHGADDVIDEGDSFTVLCAPPAFQDLREAYAANGLVAASADVAMLPQNMVKVTGDDAKTLMKLIDKLEDLDDVQNVWANFDISAEELEAIMA